MYFFFASRQMNKQDVKRAVLLACGEYIIQNKSFTSSELGNAVLQFVSSET